MKLASQTQEEGVTKRFGAAVSDVVGLSRNKNDSVSPESTLPGDDAEPKPSAPGGTGGEDEGEDREESEVEESLPLDQVFEILKNSRRRETLHYLDENGGEASLSELAEHIAALENDTTVAAISSSQRKRVYVGLYQCHLPKMDDMDIIDFDQNRGTVVRSANADQLDPYLEETTEPPWHRIYGGITATGGGLFAISVLANAPFGLTSNVVLAALVVAMGVCSLAHARQRSREE